MLKLAKISYNKLALSKLINEEPQIVHFNNFEIEVLQFLPIEKKLFLISDIINNSIDDNNFYNPCRVEIFMTVKIIECYTNLNITDKQKEDIFKLYDQLTASGLAELIFEKIPTKDYEFIYRGVVKTIKNIYKYKNSVLGILDAISEDYSNVNFDITELQNKIQDPNSLGLLKDIIEKLG